MTNAQPTPRDERTIDQIIGANVHQLMWNRGETQTKIAPQWGMDQTTLSAKLRGKRPWYASEIDAAARHYGVTRDALFTAVGPEGLEPPASTVESRRLAPVIQLRPPAA